MANTFTATRAWRMGGANGKSLLVVEGALVIDTTASGGASPDDLPASLFGLQTIIGPVTIVNDGEDKIFHAGPDHTGDSLLVGGGASQATVDLPNDTYKICITGFGATT
jgi:hypothetical protein